MTVLAGLLVLAAVLIAAALAVLGTTIFAELRGKRLPVAIMAFPFIVPKYKRG